MGNNKRKTEKRTKKMDKKVQLDKRKSSFR